MSYKKYFLYKKQESEDGGDTWHDVIPTETKPSSSPVGEYATLAECESSSSIDYGSEYFTTEAIDNNIYFAYGNSEHSRDYFNDFYYSLDNGSTWVNGRITPTVSAGSKVLWKGKIRKTATMSSYDDAQPFWATGRYKVYGNVMSVVYSDDFIGKNTLSGVTTLNHLFCSFRWDEDLQRYVGNYLVDAKNLVLPAKTLPVRAYDSMFYMQPLVEPPMIIPAETLRGYACRMMFCNTNITTTPEMTFKNVGTLACNGMFAQCKLLTTSCDLNADSVAVGGYKTMYNGCISLIKPPALPTTDIGRYNTEGSSYGLNGCYEDMFKGCTSLTTAPELPAKLITPQCYNAMFSGCTSLSYLKCLAEESAPGGTWSFGYRMLCGVNSVGLLVKSTNADPVYWTFGDPCVDTIGEGAGTVPSNWAIRSV